MPCWALRDLFGINRSDFVSLKFQNANDIVLFEYKGILETPRIGMIHVQEYVGSLGAPRIKDATLQTIQSERVHSQEFTRMQQVHDLQGLAAVQVHELTTGIGAGSNAR
jgi:hypothetical protein